MAKNLTKRPTVLTHILVVRLDEPLFEALAADAKEFDRTLSQSIRFHVRKGLGDAQ